MWWLTRICSGGQMRYKGNKSTKDVRKNCAYHKDIGHNTVKYNTLRNDIERLIRAGCFREFLENKPQLAIMNERPWRRSVEGIREVLMIFGGPHIAWESQNARDKYAKEAWSATLALVHRTEECLIKSSHRELKDIVFIEANARWVHHPYSNALVIIVRMANNNVHRMLVDDGSAMDIIHLDAYKRMRLTESELSPSTLPLYEFTGDHVVPKGTIKLVVTIGEHPRESNVMIEFLVVDYPSAFNGIIGRLLLKALKVLTSIYHLTMKLPTTEGTGQVRGSQYDSRECYNKWLKVAKMKKNLH